MTNPDPIQARALETYIQNPLLDPSDPMLQLVLGLVGEAGVLAKTYKKYQFKMHTLDHAELVKRWGAALWYVAVAANLLGLTLEELFLRNYEELTQG